jgi:hypothetical protein
VTKPKHNNRPAAPPEAEPLWDVRTCRVCGCTDDDCGQCIEKTARPCYWVEEDLCSACTDDARRDRYAQAAEVLGYVGPDALDDRLYDLLEAGARVGEMGESGTIVLKSAADFRAGAQLIRLGLARRARGRHPRELLITGKGLYAIGFPHTWAPSPPRRSPSKGGGASRKDDRCPHN